MNFPSSVRLAAIKLDLVALLERGLSAGSAAITGGLTELVHVQVRARENVNEASLTRALGDAAVSVVTDALDELGDSDDGVVGRELLLGEGSKTVRRGRCASLLAVNPKTIVRDREPRALEALAVRIIERENAYLREAAGPYALLRADPVVGTLWSAASDHSIVIAGGEIPSDKALPAGAYHVQSGDVRSITDAYSTLVALRSAGDVSVEPSSRVVGILLAQNIVSVGGPKWNTTTSQLLARIRAKWKFAEPGPVGSGAALSSTVPMRTLRASSDASGNVTSTWGFVVSARNPYNPECRVTVIAGLTTLGVLGAARAIDPLRLSATELALLKASLFQGEGKKRDCQILVEVPIIDGEIVPTKIAEDRISTWEAPAMSRERKA